MIFLKIDLAAGIFEKSPRAFLYLFDVSKMSAGFARVYTKPVNHLE